MAALAGLIWLPAPSIELWLIGVFTAGQSLVLAVVGALVAGWGLWLHRAGVRGGFALGGLGAAVAVSAVVPAVLAWGVARDADVDIAWGDYFDGTVFSAGGEPDASVTFAEVDGHQLRADVWLPPGDLAHPPDGWPTVLWVHGGSWEDGSRDDMPRWADELAGLGVAVITMDYRLIPAAGWREQAGDVACALGWIAQAPPYFGLDADRMVLLGQSAGGHLALLAAQAPVAVPPSCDVDPVAPLSVVALYPPTDMGALHAMEGWRYPDLLGTESIETLLGGNPTSQPDAYVAASPLTHASPNGPAVLLIHGRLDQIVPVDQSRRLAAALDGAGGEVTYVELPLGNHAFDMVWGAPDTQIARGVVRQHLHDRLELP